MRRSRWLLPLCSLVALPALASNPPPDSGVFWPACTSTDQWYCVESATYGGNPMTVADDIATSYPGAGMVWQTRFFDNNGMATINWEARDENGYSFFPPQYLGTNLQVVINTGNTRPSWTSARADQFHVQLSGDADAGYLMTIQGTGTETNTNATACSYTDCGDQTTQADYYSTLFGGDTFLQDKRFVGLEGMFLATNAQLVSTPAFTTTGVFLQIANPHLGVDGGPTSGSYTFWIPPSYLTSIGLTVDTVLDGGMVFDRFDPLPDAGWDGGIQFSADGGVVNGTLTELTPTLTADDNGWTGTGVIMRIDSIHYSTPTLVARKRGSGTTVTTGGGGGGGGGTPPSGGGCTSAGETLPWAGLALVFVAWAAHRRKRRHG
jgi:MYXO-CTERM domain-containing protein